MHCMEKHHHQQKNYPNKNKTDKSNYNIQNDQSKSTFEQILEGVTIYLKSVINLVQCLSLYTKLPLLTFPILFQM